VGNLDKSSRTLVTNESRWYRTLMVLVIRRRLAAAVPRDVGKKPWNSWRSCKGRTTDATKQDCLHCRHFELWKGGKAEDAARPSADER
jgi:hypothetical protein